MATIDVQASHTPYVSLFQKTRESVRYIFKCNFYLKEMIYMRLCKIGASACFSSFSSCLWACGRSYQCPSLSEAHAGGLHFGLLALQDASSSYSLFIE